MWASHRAMRNRVVRESLRDDQNTGQIFELALTPKRFRKPPFGSQFWPPEWLPKFFPKLLEKVNYQKLDYFGVHFCVGIQNNPEWAEIDLQNLGRELRWRNKSFSKNNTKCINFYVCFLNALKGFWYFQRKFVDVVWWILLISQMQPSQLTVVSHA